MKKLILSLFLVSIMSYAQTPAVKKTGIRPAWGPISSNYFRYYYLPDIDTYYDLEKSNFIYNENGKWVAKRKLQTKFKDYNLYNGYKVILNDYNGNEPYKNHKSHLVMYPKEIKGKIQKTLQTSDTYGDKSSAKVLSKHDATKKSTPSIPATRN